MVAVEINDSNLHAKPFFIPANMAEAERMLAITKKDWFAVSSNGIVFSGKVQGKTLNLDQLCEEQQIDDVYVEMSGQRFHAGKVETGERPISFTFAVHKAHTDNINSFPTVTRGILSYTGGWTQYYRIVALYPRAVVETQIFANGDRRILRYKRVHKGKDGRQ